MPSAVPLCPQCGNLVTDAPWPRLLRWLPLGRYRCLVCGRRCWRPAWLRRA